MRGRFKDDLLFFEFRDKTTIWPKATEMDLDSAKALALRINMEIQASEIMLLLYIHSSLLVSKALPCKLLLVG